MIRLDTRLQSVRRPVCRRPTEYGLPWTAAILLRQGRLPLILLWMAILAAGCSLLGNPETPFGGTGSLTKTQLPGCVAVTIGDRTRVVDEWPSGLFASADGHSVVDRNGTVVIRDGDQVAVTGVVLRVTGDTVCPDDEWFTIVKKIDLVIPTASPEAPASSGSRSRANPRSATFGDGAAAKNWDPPKQQSTG